MTTTNKYLIDNVTKSVLSEVNDENTFITILRCLLAVRHITRVGFDDLMNSSNRNRNVVDAKHVAAILLYKETYKMPLSRKQVAHLFGMQSGTSLQRAEEKMKVNMLFRKLYEAVEFRYENTVLLEYDAEIPF